MTVLSLDRVTVRVAGKTMLADVSLRLASSDLMLVVGPNGAGKTTLLRTALGLLSPTSGEVMIDGVPAARIPGRERAAKLAWLPQRGVLTEPVTALDFVCAGRFRFDESRRSAREGALSALSKAGAADLAEQRITEISGGELQRVLIASVLAQEAPLVLLDEPATSLDPAQQVLLGSLVGHLWRSGLGILWVTHDVNAAVYAAKDHESARATVLGLKAGRVTLRSNYGAADLCRSLEELFEVPMTTVSSGGRRLFVLSPPGEPGAR